MAKSKKKTKKINKYDIPFKLDMTFEEAIKLAVSTPLPKKLRKKK